MPGDTLSVRDGHAIVNGKVQDGDDDVRPCAPGTCNFPQSDQDSAGSLFYDGRQSWGERRQPILGSRPRGLDHRTGLRHLLATQTRRRLLTAPKRRQRPRSRGPAAAGAPPAGCSASTASSAAGSSPAPTRRGGGALPGPLVAAAVLLDYGRLTTREVRALTRLDDSKVHDAEQREALYPLVVRTAARVAVTSRCVRGIDERGLHVTNLAALRDTPQAGGGARTASAWWTASASATSGHAQQAVDRRRRAQRRDRRRVRRREGDARPLHAPHRAMSCPAGTSTRTSAIRRPSTARRSRSSASRDLHRRSFQSIAYQQLAIDA